MVDLGCGPGLWLELFAEYGPTGCELIGMDNDESSIAHARDWAKSWRQRTAFVQMDCEKDAAQIPDADLILAFNIFPYIADPHVFLEQVRSRLRPGGALVVRQYDGSLLRFGPMPQEERMVIDGSLNASLAASRQFRHYDLDRVFNVLSNSHFQAKEIGFESFSRVSPFPVEFIKYFNNTLDWTRNHVSARAEEILDRWREKALASGPEQGSYFIEVDLVAVLS